MAGPSNRLRAGFPEREPLPQPGLFAEMEPFIAKLELTRTVFRSDHVSNRLVLKGTLNADQARLPGKIRAAIENPDAVLLRDPLSRGLL